MVSFGLHVGLGTIGWQGFGGESIDSTPIIVITSYSIHYTKLYDAYQQQLVQTVCSSGDALLQILNDLLDVAKIESGRLTLQNEPFNLVETVAQGVNLFAETAKNKGLLLEFHADSSVPAAVVGDAGRVRQIVLNLVSYNFV